MSFISSISYHNFFGDHRLSPVKLLRNDFEKKNSWKIKGNGKIKSESRSERKFAWFKFFSFSTLSFKSNTTNIRTRKYALREFPLIEKINVNRKVIKRFIYWNFLNFCKIFYLFIVMLLSIFLLSFFDPIILFVDCSNCIHTHTQYIANDY